MSGNPDLNDPHSNRPNKVSVFEFESKLESHGIEGCQSKLQLVPPAGSGSQGFSEVPGVKN